MPRVKQGAPLRRYTGVTRKVPFKLRAHTQSEMMEVESEGERKGRRETEGEGERGEGKRERE